MGIIKKITIKIFSVLIITMFIISTYNNTNLYAHSGRTDSRGGHHDNKNKSGLGNYHYHCGGHPAHLHENGCPYDSKDTIIIYDFCSTMNVGDIQKISYKITSVSSSYATVSSSNEGVISVTEDGLLAKKEGTAIITIKSYNNSKQITINVKPIETEIESVQLSTEPFKLQVGWSKNIDSIIHLYNATNKSILYTSSNEDVATVVNGQVFAKNDGVAEITATTSNGLSQTVLIEVFSIVPNSIEASEDTIKIEMNKSCSFNLKILPASANNKLYEIINNDKICTVEKKSKTITIYPINEGETNIVIKTWNGIEKTIPIEVYSIPLETITIDDTQIPYIINKYVDLNNKNISLQYALNPNDCTYQDVVWNTSNPNIIKISNGKFEIVGTGKVILTCQSVKDNNISACIEIIIVDKDKIITISIIIIITIVVLSVFITRTYKKNKYSKI